jgi:hypothetical protein
MPFLIGLTAAFAAFWAAIAVLVIVLLVSFALLGIGSFEFNGEPVTRAEFLRRMPTAALIMLAIATYFAALAVGVWRERAWVRPAVLVLWLGVSAFLVGQGIGGNVGLIEALAWSTIYMGFVGWYFYGKSNVVAYYRALEKREREAANPVNVDQAAAG